MVSDEASDCHLPVIMSFHITRGKLGGPDKGVQYFTLHISRCHLLLNNFNPQCSPRGEMSKAQYTHCESMNTYQQMEHRLACILQIVLCCQISWIWCLTDVQRHHGQGQSYKGKHLIGTSLQFQRFSPLSSWQEVWQCLLKLLKVLHLDLKAARRRLSPAGSQEEDLDHWPHLSI